MGNSESRFSRPGFKVSPTIYIIDIETADTVMSDHLHQKRKELKLMNKCTHREHYQKSDFTSEEVAQGNVLAILVLTKKVRVCKQCGKTSKPGATRYNAKVSKRTKDTKRKLFLKGKKRIEKRWREGRYTTYREAEKDLILLNSRYGGC